MANQLFNALNRSVAQMPNIDQSFIGRFNKFRKNFQGNPRQRVQELLNSGDMSQDDFNRLSNLTNQIHSMFR